MSSDRDARKRRIADLVGCALKNEPIGARLAALSEGDQAEVRDAIATLAKLTGRSMQHLLEVPRSKPVRRERPFVEPDELHVSEQ